jgi:polyketide biosynthesis acyl carrier protein
MNQQEIFDIIVSHTRAVVPGLENHKFQYSDSLRELGANSIDRSEIVMMTLESLSLRIPLIEIAAVRNIGDLACAIRDRA